MVDKNDTVDDLCVQRTPKECPIRQKARRFSGVWGYLCRRSSDITKPSTLFALRSGMQEQPLPRRTHSGLVGGDMLVLGG